MNVGQRIELLAEVTAFDRTARIGDQGVIQKTHADGRLTVRMDDGRQQFPHRDQVAVLEPADQ